MFRVTKRDVKDALIAVLLIGSIFAFVTYLGISGKVDQVIDISYELGLDE